MDVLGLIPARKGSKSIKDKNLCLLNGVPLIHYVIKAAKKAKSLTQVICSTNDTAVMEICDQHGVNVQVRPENLAQDDTPIIDVVQYVLNNIDKKPDIVVLLQPTSPFIRPVDINNCVGILEWDDHYRSAQTVTTFSHNFHAFNQRIVEHDNARFVFEYKREKAYNKQKKPCFYIFGNVVATRTEGMTDIFMKPSYPFIIPRPYAMDIDGPEDIELAEWYLQTGQVRLS